MNLSYIILLCLGTGMLGAAVGYLYGRKHGYDGGHMDGYNTAVRDFEARTQASKAGKLRLVRGEKGGTL